LGDIVEEEKMTELGLLALAIGSTFALNLGEADRDIELEFGIDAAMPGASYDELDSTHFHSSSAHAPHGLFRLRYVEKALVPGQGETEIELNTDTATLAWNQPGLLGPWSFLKVYGRGQGVYGNMLADYAQDGKQIPGRSFGAAYLLAGAFGRLTPVHAKTLNVSFDTKLEARQWFHYKLPDTDATLVLPANHPTLESTVGIGILNGEKKTVFQRTHGFSVSGEATLFLRPGIQDWGAVQGADNGRNKDLDSLAARGQARMTGGAVGPNFTFFQPILLSSIDLGYGIGLDDRYRFMVGGVSPYVVQLAGAGWGEFLADRYVGGHLQIGALVMDRVALEAGVDLVMINDPARTGNVDDFGLLRGYFAQLELMLADSLKLQTIFSLGSGQHRTEHDFNPAIWAALQWTLYPF
jgi:hypothetical protein